VHKYRAPSRAVITIYGRVTLDSTPFVTTEHQVELQEALLITIYGRVSLDSTPFVTTEHEVELQEALESLAKLHGNAERCHQTVAIQVERMAAELVDAVHRRRDLLLEACEAFARGEISNTHAHGCLVWS
jgi:uncharacterized Fe-S cluster-containing protein